MRKVTKEITHYFLNGISKRVSNSRTDGSFLILHGNKIAKFDSDGFLWISSAGWQTNLTKERLNALPNVNICQKNFNWYLNGKEWTGDWTKIDYKRELWKNQI